MKPLARIAVVVIAYFSLAIPQANAEFITDPSVLYGASAGGALFTLDPTNGIETLVGLPSEPNAFVGLAFQPGTAIVPEPSSIVMLGIGCVALCGYGWRRKAA